MLTNLPCSNGGEHSSHALQVKYFSRINENRESDKDTPHSVFNAVKWGMVSPETYPEPALPK